jgi:hypothetical protein
LWQHCPNNFYPSLCSACCFPGSASPRLQSGTHTVTWNETHSLLVSIVAPRLSPETIRTPSLSSEWLPDYQPGMRTPSSSPEWYPDCHLELDAFHSGQLCQYKYLFLLSQLYVEHADRLFPEPNTGF